MDDLVEITVKDMPQYDLYEDGSQHGEMFSNLEEEQDITPKWEDQYYNAEHYSLEKTRLRSKMPIVI